MNRAHNPAEALRSLEILNACEIEVFNVDLIYGNPNQPLEKLGKDVEMLLEFSPPHVSAYSLTIEPETRLGKQVALKKIVPLADDAVAAHFDLIYDKLEQAEIRQYEVSNFAKLGYEAKHNSNYWKHKNYLGFGPGAHSFWWDNGAKSACRWSNERNLFKYSKGEWRKRHGYEDLSLGTLAEERLMLALRTVEGVKFSTLKSKYGFEFSNATMDYLHQKVRERKIFPLKNGIQLTKDGLKIADAIILDLLTINDGY